jgi:uncharacterized protein YcaQ
LREDLVSSGDLVPVSVEGVRGRRYVLGLDMASLRASEADVAAGQALAEPGVTFLAPLDPFVWDRDLLRALFGFDYKWEVYTPQEKRRFGYYVLPVLWGDRLVGRIEPRIDRASGSVRILGLWWEHGIRPRQEDGLVEAMRSALAAYLRFAAARKLDWGERTSEQRLFGVRPRER